MSVELIQEKLNEYSCKTARDEELALREITQEIALAGLARRGFFNAAVFHGGTCLRLCHQLNRFSEDLDFALKTPDTTFRLSAYLKDLSTEFSAYGYRLEITDRSKLGETVQKAFLKDHSLGGLLELRHLRFDRSLKKIRIKLEVDTNPPAGGKQVTHWLSFPFNFGITIHDLPSLFAGKLHALLCRNFSKARDWYDFLWYIRHKTPVNYDLLSSSLKQTGPWQGQDLDLNPAWLDQAVRKVVQKTDWEAVRREIRPFIKPEEFAYIDAWNEDFVLNEQQKWAAE